MGFLFLIAIIFLESTSANAGECEDKIPSCHAIKKYCRPWADKLKYSCSKTCGYCGDGCEDKWNDCHNMTAYCSIYPSLKSNCRKSCGFCGTKEPISCKRNFEKYGCFKVSDSSQMDLLINDEDVNSPYYQGYLLNWEDYKNSIHSLACRCNKKALDLGYTFFSLRFLAECWAGRDIGVVQQSKSVQECYKLDFEKCDDKDWRECIGSTGHDYIYRVSTNAPSPPSVCEDKRNDCEQMKDMCITNPDKVRGSCAKTCGFCVSNCVDDKDYCKEALLPYCDLPGYRKSMKKYCQKTCNFCGPKCVDRHPDCAHFKDHCASKELIGFCDLTCGFCKDDGHGGRIDLCKDKRSDCPNLLQYCNISSFKEQMTELCPKSCEFCKSREIEEDKTLCHKDKLPTERCQTLKRLRYCRFDKRMENFCQKTCEFCELPPPTACSSSKYGCCWDMDTIKVDEGGSNCLPCKDKYADLCRRRKSACREAGPDGDFLRQNCPQTCGRCRGPCQDAPIIAHKCDFWKNKMNYCTTMRKEMMELCPATCSYC